MSTLASQAQAVSIPFSILLSATQHTHAQNVAPKLPERWLHVLAHVCARQPRHVIETAPGCAPRQKIGPKRFLQASAVSAIAGAAAGESESRS